MYLNHFYWYNQYIKVNLFKNIYNSIINKNLIIYLNTKTISIILYSIIIIRKSSLTTHEKNQRITKLEIRRYNKNDYLNIYVLHSNKCICSTKQFIHWWSTRYFPINKKCNNQHILNRDCFRHIWINLLHNKYSPIYSCI